MEFAGKRAGQRRDSVFRGVIFPFSVAIVIMEVEDKCFMFFIIFLASYMLSKFEILILIVSKLPF